MLHIIYIAFSFVTENIQKREIQRMKNKVGVEIELEESYS